MDREKVSPKVVWTKKEFKFIGSHEAQKECHSLSGSQPLGTYGREAFSKNFR
jgi:hypothetical protein